MIQMTTAGPDSATTLEISDRRLPARMVAGRLRADLSRQVAMPPMSRRFRARMLVTVLLAVAVPLFSATRSRNARL